MTHDKKPNPKHPDFEKEQMFEGSQPTEFRHSTAERTVFLAQASGTCRVPVEVQDKSRMDCVTAGWYVAPEVTPEEIEHPALETKRHLH